ncbi:MAG: hypothetical protein AB1324_01880 [Candidatus Micrarchaeota archaeon]
MKNKAISYLFVILWLLVFGGAAYFVLMYMGGLFTAIVDFVTTNDYSKLQQCGVTPPPEFNKLKADLPTILPAVYLGPVAIFFASFLMFLAGYFYHKARLESEAKKAEEMERQMVHKIVNKMEGDKPSRPAQPSGGPMQSKKRRVVEKVVEEDPSGRYREVQTEEETREGSVDESEEYEEEPEEEEPPPRKRR